MQRWIVGAALAALLSGSAQAQTAAPAPAAAPANNNQEPTSLSGVTVTAQRLDKIAQFVGQVTAPNDTHRLARWDGTVCMGVTGLPAVHAQYMNDAIARYAVLVGLDIGKPGCKPNIIVLVAPDADKLVPALVKKYPNAFGKYSSMIGDYQTRGRKALKKFAETPAPVRWWHVSQMKNGSGFGLSDDKTIEVSAASHIHSDIREDFDHVIIVIDAKSAGGVPYDSLCAYVSMVALAQLNPDVDSTAVPSILNLFHDRDAGVKPPLALTEWDMTYLKGLYGARRDAKDASRQKKDIVDQIKKDESAPPKQ